MRVLVTAFERYGEFGLNASELCLEALAASLSARPVAGVHPDLRLYPVDFSLVREQLARDLSTGYDASLHLGQSPRSAALHLEEIAVNRGALPDAPQGAAFVLQPEGPLALCSGLPVSDWAARLSAAGIPARASYHAGTYLCNAALYWSLWHASQRGAAPRAMFVHLPFEPRQATPPTPTLPAAVTSAGVRLLLEWLVESAVDGSGEA